MSDLANSMHYFAYGSNLDPEQMAERCPEARPLEPGVLRGYRLVFGGHSPHWDGAPATIVPDDDALVPGLVYELPYAEIRVLDHFEGHPVRYERRELSVASCEGDAEWETHVYIKQVDGDYDVPPDDYLEVLRENYRRLGFDVSLLDEALEMGRSS